MKKEIKEDKITLVMDLYNVARSTAKKIIADFKKSRGCK